MLPYPRVRHHKSKRHGERSFQGYLYFFNYRHYYLRNVIKHTFNGLKKRFWVLWLRSQYRVARKQYIVVSCCIMHNVICIITLNERIIQWFCNLASYERQTLTDDLEDLLCIPDMLNTSTQAMVAMMEAIALPIGHIKYRFES